MTRPASSTRNNAFDVDSDAGNDSEELPESIIVRPKRSAASVLSNKDTSILKTAPKSLPIPPVLRKNHLSARLLTSTSNLSYRPLSPDAIRQGFQKGGASMDKKDLLASGEYAIHFFFFIFFLLHAYSFLIIISSALCLRACSLFTSS